MPSNDGSEPLDLDRTLVVTEEDVATLRRLRAGPPCSTEEWLRILARLKGPSREALRSRKGPSGEEPFRL